MKQFKWVHEGLKKAQRILCRTPEKNPDVDGTISGRSVRRMVSVEAGHDVRTFSHFYDGPLRIYVNDECVYDRE